ncbi:GntR family transcriptional regulator, partial [Nonomuraea sp. NN258]|uniref:GntR family transcriptional regulator n=1 Tax=Nonomuraea antri TaxID=2730852 RepID=UPI001569BA1D
MSDARPRYLQIAADIERRIAEATLRPGDPVPTTRMIMREWNVAMATATKALAALKQKGLIESAPRVGAVVAAPVLPGGDPDGDRAVQVAMEIADSFGLNFVSLRAVASRLGVSTMELAGRV